MIHASRRMLAVALAVATLSVAAGPAFTAAAASGVTTDGAPYALAEQARQLADALVEAFVFWTLSLSRWVSGLDLGPLHASPGLWLVLGGGTTLSLLLVALLLHRPPSLEADVAEKTARQRPPRRLRTKEHAHTSAPVATTYRGPRDEEYARGRLAGSRVESEEIDDALAYVARAEMGEPRILRSMPNLMRVRLEGCRGCANAEHGDAAGCAFECGFFETSFQRVLRSRVLVHEVACRGRGAHACDFEVWY